MNGNIVKIRSDDEMCQCGHTSFWHVNFGNGRCDRRPVEVRDGCSCAAFAPKEQGEIQ